MVLVFQPVVVVDCDKHIDEIIGSFWRDVANGNVHNLRIFVCQRNTQFTGITFGRIFDTGMTHMDDIIIFHNPIFTFQVICGVYTHQANRRIDGIAKFGQNLARHFYTLIHKIRKSHTFAFVRDFHIELCPNVVKVAQQIHGRRKALVVKQNGAKATFSRIVHIQMQQTHRFFNVVKGAEGNQFVENFRTPVHDTHFRKIHDIIPFLIRFHQQFGSTGIDRNGLMEIVGRQT